MGRPPMPPTPSAVPLGQKSHLRGVDTRSLGGAYLISRPPRRRRTLLPALLLILVFLAVPYVQAAHPVPAEPTDTPFVLARDAIEGSGIDFVHAGHRVDRYQAFAETTMGGACWGDYDADGDVDLFVPDSLGPDDEGRSRLYRNDGPGPEGTHRFTDVTEDAVPDRPGMAQGCVWGDYDADGHLDLFVTYVVADYSFQGPVLYRNIDGARFEDVTEEAGISGDAGDPDSDEACLAQAEDDDGDLHGLCFTVAAAWLDYDLDGDLDLYLGNYVNHPEGSCSDARSPNPILCTGQPNRLFRNEADGTFTEVGRSAKADVNGEVTKGRSLGIVATDINGDSWPDIYVANDFDANALYLSMKNGVFSQASFHSNSDGIGPRINKGVHHRAGMGLDATDLDNDGRVDLLSTHLGMQYDAVLLARHDEDKLYWEEVADNSSGVEAMARTVSRWGGGFTDFDLDGHKDIFAVSGHQYAEIPGPMTLLMREDGDYIAQTAPHWPFGNDTTESHRNYRGAAIADYDDDGDMDLFLTALEDKEGPGIPRLLAFHTADTTGMGAHPDNPGRGHHWLRIALEATDSARAAIGAHVAVTLEDGTTVHEWMKSGGSYANDNDPRLLLGLGDQSKGEVTIVWPGGTRDGPHPFDLEDRPGTTLHFVEPNERPPVPARWTADAEPENGAVTVRWAGTHVPDFAAYKVYLGHGRVEPGRTGLEDAEVFTFEDRDTHEATIPVPGGGDVWLRTTVVDKDGFESAPSGFERLTIEDNFLPVPSGLLVAMLAVAVIAIARRRD